MGLVLTRDQLPEWLTAFRQLTSEQNKPLKLVTTNGVFDLMHVGHLRYLQASRAMGDALLLCVNSDASVRRLKGPTRPIVPENERAELLVALGCVDAVVLFDEDTPEALLEIIRPDIHVKGSQYTAETLPEAQLLARLGTELCFADMVEGHSSTDLIQRVLQAHGH